MVDVSKGIGYLHDPNDMRALAKQLREEAQRLESQADQITQGKMQARCAPGCWNIRSTCFFVQPL